MKKTPGDVIILQKWTKNHDQMLYCSWDTAHDGCNYFLLKANFCTFTPLTAWKMKLKKKMEKNPGDIIILHKCTKNQDHMLYCSWDMARHRYNCYFSFWTILYPFTLLTAQKKKILQKWRKHLEMSSFYTSVPKIMIMYYTVPEIWCVTDVIIFHFGPIFALLPP